MLKALCTVKTLIVDETSAAGDAINEYFQARKFCDLSGIIQGTRRRGKRSRNVMS